MVLERRTDCLQVFDDRICAATKAEMVQAMETNVGVENHTKRPQIKENNIASLKPVNFVTQNTMKFFEIIGIASDWLKNDPNLWSQVSEATRQIVSGLSVVNDRAERGVALIEEYNQILTKDEGQKQALLQVVSEHQKQFPDAKKSSNFEITVSWQRT